ncbi:ketosteroid isomerase-like protein/8-oxo-dGTP pyrophosphatase MutT (NUDIX family) [Devosia sp. UYZn731]|uniref:nuclear transport factor 2 family protein n=1 Tax=Devosia sp. UYZn731 TaxID=3156345 RepID=UPI003395BD3D
MAKNLVEKVCPVIFRGVGDAREILVFRHPLAGVQLVKGTREAGESVIAGALRELAEEAGIVEDVTGVVLCSSSAIALGQLWHFVLVETADLPEHWAFDTLDDGGHRFEFFWCTLDATPEREWHPDFVRALKLVRDAIVSNGVEAAKTLSRYAELINNHSFDDVAPLIAPEAVFWFGDGSHAGLSAIRSAFEGTWRNLTGEIYWLEDVRWIAQGDYAAACLYRFHWQATGSGECREGSGRGTSVFVRRPEGWKIIHEHLSALPA